MEGRYRFIRYFAYALELLVLYMIQQTPAFSPLCLERGPF